MNNEKIRPRGEWKIREKENDNGKIYYEVYCSNCEERSSYLWNKELLKYHKKAPQNAYCGFCGTNLDWDFADFEILETIRKGENA